MLAFVFYSQGRVAAEGQKRSIKIVPKSLLQGVNVKKENSVSFGELSCYTPFEIVQVVERRKYR